MLIDEALIHLIRTHEKNRDHAGGLFYSELLNQMNKIEDVNCPTAAVYITDKINLVINPYFWKSLKINEQVDLLKHELGHIVNDHISIWKEKFPELKKTETHEDKVSFMKAMDKVGEWNKAADLELNEYLPNVPKEFKIFDKEGNPIADVKGFNVETMIKDNPKLMIERRQSMGYYHNFLKEQKKKKQPQDGNNSGMQTLDDHSMWAEGSSNPEEIKERVKKAVNKAAQTARQAGRLPGDLELAIERLNYKPKNWKNDLKRFIGNSIEVLADSSRKVRNRRFGLMFPGIKKYPKLHIGIPVDTSGSVRDEAVCQFFAEIAKICSEDVKVTIIEFDAAVNNVYDFDPKKKVKIQGRGGTMFAPVFAKANELGLDGLIFLTDGGCFDTNALVKPRYPVLWGIVEGQKPNVPWGKVTNITVTKK